MEKQPKIDIYLIRHAESEANRRMSHILTGQSKDVDLSEDGLTQAERLGRRLIDEGVRFDQVYSSTALRAAKTCDIVARIIKYPCN